MRNLYQINEINNKVTHHTIKVNQKAQLKRRILILQIRGSEISWVLLIVNSIFFVMISALVNIFVQSF
jgi:hypothetical protein